ncbi:MAG TPA: ThuA domain-containing protein [Myxococcota bacterium]|nr:ThuA domain-containing protein [Myxococcota bacterium]
MKRTIGARAAMLALLVGCALALSGCDVLRGIFPKHEYETTPLELPADLTNPALLVFTKTNGFRHTEAIPAGVALIESIAKRRGWSVFHTESGAVFNDAQLAKFQATVWHQVSGDVLTPEQRAALQRWIEGGGGWLGVHGAGGDREYAWPWYVHDLVGAQFIGHTMGPQFQTATWENENPLHPATQKLPEKWQHEEEIYSFAESPRERAGFIVLVSVDESTYSPVENILWNERDLRMKDGDHPMVWQHCVERGRALYSALGHQAKAYAEPEMERLLEGAMAWVLRVEGVGCE